jgi:hypothetical protein
MFFCRAEARIHTVYAAAGRHRNVRRVIAEGRASGVCLPD